mgnify:CR=1 FL=1
MYALMQYIRDYIRNHPDEYQEWLKKKGEEDVRVMIQRAMDRNHITDAGKIQPGQKLLIPVLKDK